MRKNNLLKRIANMQLFFNEAWSEHQARLSAEESRHCVQVLRKKIGEEIYAIDGKGNFLTLRIAAIEKKDQVLCEVLAVQEDWHPVSYDLHLLVAPTKNTDRMEWLLEKATEIGVSRITPVICQRSERRQLRLDRLEKVMLSAVKQSLKARIPRLDEPLLFKDCLFQKGFEGMRYIAHCEPGDKLSLSNNYIPGTSVKIWIGPEGDFSPEEIAQAITAGWQPLTLGSSRLRTETAALLACCTIYQLNQ